MTRPHGPRPSWAARMLPRAIALVAILGAAVALRLLGTTGGPIVWVVNDSPEVAAEIAVTTADGVTAFGPLTPGAQRCCGVPVRGESGLAIAFVAEGVAHSADDLAYLEGAGGYCEAIRIGPGFEVGTSSADASCGWLRASLCRLASRCGPE